MNTLTKYSLAFLLLAVAGCTRSAQEETRPQPATIERVEPAARPDVVDTIAVETVEQTEDASPPAPEEPPTTLPPAGSLDELLLFFPSKHPAGNWSPQDLTYEDVWFNSDDETRIHGWYCPCEDARAVLLYAHGNAGNLSHRSRILSRLQRQARVAVLIFDYRGYGRSEGVPTVEGMLADSRAARAFLAEHAAVQESDIILMGRSLGGAVATQLAAEIQPRGLILESTFSSLKDVATEHYPKFAWLVPPEKLNSVSQIARYEGPLLQSHGDADRTIPYALGKKLFDAAGGRKQFVTIPNVGHNGPQSDEYYEQLDRFIRNLSVQE